MGGWKQGARVLSLGRDMAWLRNQPDKDIWRRKGVTSGFPSIPICLAAIPEGFCCARACHQVTEQVVIPCCLPLPAAHSHFSGQCFTGKGWAWGSPVRDTGLWGRGLREGATLGVEQGAQQGIPGCWEHCVMLILSHIILQRWPHLRPVHQVPI